MVDDDRERLLWKVSYLVRRFARLTEDRAEKKALGNLVYVDYDAIQTELDRLDIDLMSELMRYQDAMEKKPLEFWLNRCRRRIQRLRNVRMNQWRAGVLTERDARWFAKEIAHQQRKIAYLKRANGLKSGSRSHG